jgi:hypothetical protein
MKILPFQLPNYQVILLAPVSVSDRIPFLILLNQVRDWWSQSELNLKVLADNEGIWATIQSLINFIPRKDIKNSFGFDINLFRKTPEKLTNLILIELINLNEEKKQEIIEVKEGNEEFRTPSSGDVEADLVADLCQSLKQNAFYILNNYDIETVNSIIKRLNYNNMPTEKREELEKAHEARQAHLRFQRSEREGKLSNLKWSEGYSVPL